MVVLLTVVTCVARGVAADGRVVVVAVVNPHRRHHHSADRWLAGLGLRSDAGHPGLTVLIPAGHVALLYEGTAVVARRVGGG